jgi:hypothetical protein
MTGIDIYNDWLAALKTGNDATQRARLAEYLDECEKAKTILRAKGWGKAGTSIADVASSVPDAPKVVKNIWSGK